MSISQREYYDIMMKGKNDIIYLIFIQHIQISFLSLYTKQKIYNYELNKSDVNIKNILNNKYYLYIIINFRCTLLI